MWMIEIGDEGLCTDRPAQLINNCVAREESELCRRDERIAILMGAIWGH